MMKKLVYYILPLLFLFANKGDLMAQNQINMTQYMVHQPLINMAAIGSYDNLNGALMHRQQWVGFDGAPNTSMLSVNSPLKGKNFHIGGVFMQDRIGANQRTTFDLGFAYRMQLNEKNYLSLALSGGADHMVSDYSDLYLNDVDDPNFPNGSVSSFQPDFGFGAYFFSEKYYVGLSIPSLLRSANLYPERELVIPEDFHYYLQAGYQFRLNDDFDLGISTLVKTVLGSPIQYDVNVQPFFRDIVGLGLSYRSSHDIAGILTLNINESFTVSYSYDLGFSEFSAYHRNTHEVMLIYRRPAREMLRLSSPRF